MAHHLGKSPWHKLCSSSGMPCSQAEAQLALMRAEIQRYGQTIVPCDRLLVLIPENDPIGAQFGHIFATAARERWSFEFRVDGTVRFANLDPSTDLTLRWPEQDALHLAKG
jgi:hypothetical protein